MTSEITPAFVSIEVFTKLEPPADPYCPQCVATVRLLNKLVGPENFGVYTREQGDGPALYEEGREKGLSSAPLTRITFEDGSTEIVSGYNAPRIKQLIGA